MKPTEKYLKACRFIDKQLERLRKSGITIDEIPLEISPVKRFAASQCFKIVRIYGKNANDAELIVDFVKMLVEFDIDTHCDCNITEGILTLRMDDRMTVGYPVEELSEKGEAVFLAALSGKRIKLLEEYGL
ncbi:MAG: hypothetical protein LBB64_06055 [Dysgonamonadaceae bacterium]|jgi:hypothetical protein|nr:hypothetical protein [Dysgonamonadaceae bacterium]